MLLDTGVQWHESYKVVTIWQHEGCLGSLAEVH